ncbi:MAG: S-methyl-5'-thioadenosine phosphorylase [Spirochaetota bacterium]
MAGRKIIHRKKVPAHASIGIIGGSGVYQIDGVRVIAKIKPRTPFGYPSDEIVIADIGGTETAFLPRHGKGHRLTPTEIPVQANIYALKLLGVESIVAISAVGSLKESIAPRDFVVPSQIIDRTKSRVNSFFGGGIVGHVTFDKPFCPTLSAVLYDTLRAEQHTVHRDETYICMEGPLFSTKAESELYRSWGAGIIGMTALPEAKLAREAEICYAMIAMSTDYDCWHPEHGSVTLEMVIANANANSAKVKSFLPKVIARIDAEKDCSCRHAGEFAVMTAPSALSKAAKKRLGLFYGKYWKQ